MAGDATGRALKEGYVVVVPGTRGRNSRDGETYTGRASKAILDLKAAIRYLRRFDKQIPGNTERIITDGTSAGGAMSALMGGTLFAETLLSLPWSVFVILYYLCSD